MSHLKNRNFKLSDLSNETFLDYKRVDAQSTNFKNNSFNNIIASNMIHHIAFPIKLLKKIKRILKKNGRLIIYF